MSAALSSPAPSPPSPAVRRPRSPPLTANTATSALLPYDLLLATAPTSPTLTLTDIATAFAAMTTAPTTAARFALVEGLLRQATALDAKYLLKLMLADMRIGVKQALIEEAIAIAAGSELPALRNAVMLEADLAHAATRAFEGTLAEARMALFHPLGFMLASPVETPEEAVERFSTANQPGIHAYLEDKYDGMRCQLHCGDPDHPGRVALYSRNREDITPGFPEIAEAFAHVTEPIILDGELLGWDLAADQALPFSILGQRIGRKRVTNDIRRTIPVIFMAFDLLYQQGELLLPLPLNERRARLEALAARLAPATVSPLEFDPHANADQSHLFAVASTEPPIPRLRLSPAVMVESAEAIDSAYAAARARANEGVMLKSASSAYQPGRRGLSWVKLKRELATLDVVITGAEFGHGRRAGLLSDYTFAVRGPNGVLLNVGKALLRRHRRRDRRTHRLAPESHPRRPRPLPHRRAPPHPRGRLQQRHALRPPRQRLRPPLPPHPPHPRRQAPRRDRHPRPRRGDLQLPARQGVRRQTEQRYLPSLSPSPGNHSVTTSCDTTFTNHLASRPARQGRISTGEMTTGDLHSPSSIPKSALPSLIGD